MIEWIFSLVNKRGLNVHWGTLFFRDTFYSRSLHHSLYVRLEHRDLAEIIDVEDRFFRKVPWIEQRVL